MRIASKTVAGTLTCHPIIEFMPVWGLLAVVTTHHVRKHFKLFLFKITRVASFFPLNIRSGKILEEKPQNVGD